MTRLKENLEKMTEERDQRVAGENREKEQNKRMQRQIRDIKEEMTELAKKEAEASRKKHELVSNTGMALNWIEILASAGEKCLTDQISCINLNKIPLIFTRKSGL